MEKTLVTKGCLGCSLLNIRGDWFLSAMVDSGVMCLAVLTFVDTTYVGGHLRAIL